MLKRTKSSVNVGVWGLFQHKFWLQSGYDFTAVDDCEDLSHRWKIGRPPNAAVFEPVSNVFCEKKTCKEPHRWDRLPLFARIFQWMVVIARSRDFDSLWQPFWTFATVNGQNSRWIRSPWVKGPIPPMGFCFCGKTRILRPIVSLLIETIGSQVVVSMFTCSRRPPIFDLPGCHARVGLPGCQ